MGIKPIFNNVVLKLEEGKDKKSSSGFILTHSNASSDNIAEVIATGEGREGEKMKVSVGDRVLFAKYATQEINMNDECFLVIDQNDIFAIIEE